MWWFEDKPIYKRKESKKREEWRGGGAVWGNGAFLCAPLDSHIESRHRLVLRGLKIQAAGKWTHNRANSYIKCSSIGNDRMVMYFLSIWQKNNSHSRPLRNSRALKTAHFYTPTEKLPTALQMIPSDELQMCVSADDWLGWPCCDTCSNLGYSTRGWQMEG